MILGLKFFYGKPENLDFKKAPVRYVFSMVIDVFLWYCMSKGLCIKEGFRQKLQSKHYNGKKQTEREGRERVRIWNFQGYWKNSKSIFLGLIKDNVEYSGHDQVEIMWNFHESWF